MNFEYRQLIDEDIHYINSFHSDLIQQDKNNSITKYITSKGVLLGDVFEQLCLSEDAKTKASVVLDSGHFVGAVMYNIDRVDEKNIMDLEAIIVHPQHTGKGIGRRILQDIIRYSFEIFGTEIDTIQALVEKDNKPSQRIFDINNFHKKIRNKNESDKYLVYNLEID